MSAVSVDDWTNRRESRLVDDLEAKVVRLRNLVTRQERKDRLAEIRAELPSMTDGEREAWLRTARDVVSRELLKRNAGPIGPSRPAEGRRDESPHLHVVMNQKGNGHQRSCRCPVCRLGD